MSAVPSEIPLTADADSHRGTGLPRNARIYFVAIALSAAAATIPFVGRISHSHGWLAFALLGGAAAIAQLFVVQIPRRSPDSTTQTYHTSIVFLIPAIMMLPPELVALLSVVQHLPEWLKTRHAWYIQTFNICFYTLCSMGAWTAAHLITNAHILANANLRTAVAGLAAAAVFVLLNHTMLAVMMNLASGYSVKETGLFGIEAFSTDLVLAALGVAVFAFWQSNPWLILFAAAPLVLIHRALSVPALQAEARVDPKTGLFNARHFSTALADELARAQRFDRPLSLIMADLDLLRDINNTYGHLAGDAVLQGLSLIHI